MGAGCRGFKSLCPDQKPCEAPVSSCEPNSPWVRRVYFALRPTPYALPGGPIGPLGPIASSQAAAPCTGAIWACHHRSRLTPEASLDCGSVAAALCRAAPILGAGASSFPCPKAPLRHCGRCVESKHRRPRIPPSGRPGSTPRRRARNGKAGSHLDPIWMPSPLSPRPRRSFALPTLPFQFSSAICEVLAPSEPSRWVLPRQIGPRLSTKVSIRRYLQTHSVRVTILDTTRSATSIGRLRTSASKRAVGRTLPAGVRC